MEISLYIMILTDYDYSFWRIVLPSGARTLVAWPRYYWSTHFKDFNIGDKVTPLDVDDGTEAVLLEPLEWS